MSHRRPRDRGHANESAAEVPHAEAPEYRLDDPQTLALLIGLLRRLDDHFTAAYANTLLQQGDGNELDAHVGTSV